MSSSVSVDPLYRVAVAGGTHGNEMSGVYLVKHWLKDPSELVRDTFSAVPVLSNPKASEIGVRYYEKDLNRCFTTDFLSSSESPGELYEESRAREINRLFGPKGSGDTYDMILDLHNTTSNMGVCLIVSGLQNHLDMHTCHYIQTQMPECNPRVFVYTKPGADPYDVSSVAKSGLGFELGPQPQGVVRADVLQNMKKVVEITLDFVNQLNKGIKFPAFELDVYRNAGHVDFPRSSDGEISAVIHPSLQDQDFSLLHPGDPIFLTLDGQTIPYSGEEPIYPVFINEAAYYEKKTAFIVTEKIHISVPALKAHTEQKK
ncbi:N-acyl-aromatic-L-amino acid amidohydrolase (carboxylate-forming)-like isoform X2 [Hyperolius riggenbachi]